MKLETSVSKDQILDDYLNTIYFGRGAYGIEVASQQYFGKSVSDLDLGQARSPRGDHPLARQLRPGRPEQRRAPQGPLDLRARRHGREGLDHAGAEGVRRVPQVQEARSRPTASAAPTATCSRASRQALFAQGITEDELNRGGYRVVSTFDKTAQRAAVKAVEDEAPTSGTKGLRIGLVAVKPGTGEVVAMYGGKDFITSPINNATQAIGQAGSTFKPFALAAGVEDGVALDSVWNGDSGVTIDGYKVNNYGDRSWGEITLLKGTEQSVNSVYVGLSEKVGYDKVLEAATRAGIPEDAVGLVPVRSVALGVASPHVIDIAGAYATFAARGLQTDTVVIKEVRGPNGGVIFALDPTPTQAFDPEVADTVNYALQKVVTNGTGSAARALGRPAAGKTGTTNDNKSAWFAGYTPDLAVAVMFVKDGADGKPVSLSGVGGMDSVTGGSFPARIWTAFMRGALEGTPVSKFVRPMNLPTATPTPTESPSVSPTPTTSPTATPTATPSPSGSPSSSPTPTPTPTPTSTPSASPTTSAGVGGSAPPVANP